MLLDRITHPEEIGSHLFLWQPSQDTALSGKKTNRAHRQPSERYQDAKS